ASHCDERAGGVLIVVLRPNPVRAPIRVGNSYLVDVTIEELCAAKETNPAPRISWGRGGSGLRPGYQGTILVKPETGTIKCSNNMLPRACAHRAAIGIICSAIEI